MSKFSNNDLTLFSRILFDRALDDVNSVLAPSRVLKEPEVSFASFRKYISEHHPLIHQEPSIDRLSMVLYQKAINDIAFQADIFSFLYRDIPIRRQRASCEFAVTSLKNRVAEMSTRTAV
jgi:hypothetical protein